MFWGYLIWGLKMVTKLRRLIQVLGAAFVLLMLSFSGALAAPGDTARVSTDAAGVEGNGDSTYPAISADGRYVAFMSYASNLVPGDTNSTADIFVKDTLTGSITRVSTDSGGGQSNGASMNPVISADGRYVAFLSDASNLVPGDDPVQDAFVKDTQTGVITKVSTGAGGIDPGANYVVTISADGRYVAYQSYQMVGCCWDRLDVFSKDTVTGTTTRLNADPAGNPVSSTAITRHATSADMSFFAFSSYSDFLPGDNNSKADVFVRNTLTGAVTRVSTDAAGGQANGDSGGAAISANGRYVAFFSQASNLLPGSTGPSDIAGLVLKDTQTGAITRIVQSTATAEAVSDDGRYVYFVAYYDVFPGDTNLAKDVYVRDTLTGTTTRLSTSSSGGQASMSPFDYLNPMYADSLQASVSADGRYVAFASGALNLVPGKANWLASSGRYAMDVYVKDTSGCRAASLSLSRTRVYWSSYEDYTIGWLSIDYRIDNHSGYRAFGASITNASNTNGVTMATGLPYALGDIAGGGSATFTLRYIVPAGVSSFRTTVNAGASDACGAAHSYP